MALYRSTMFLMIRVHVDSWIMLGITSRSTQSTKLSLPLRLYRLFVLHGHSSCSTLLTVYTHLVEGTERIWFNTSWYIHAKLYDHVLRITAFGFIPDQ